jgi:hypothetical protein
MINKKLTVIIIKTNIQNKEAIIEKIGKSVYVANMKNIV